MLTSLFPSGITSQLIQRQYDLERFDQGVTLATGIPMPDELLRDSTFGEVVRVVASERVIEQIATEFGGEVMGAGAAGTFLCAFNGEGQRHLVLPALPL